MLENDMKGWHGCYSIAGKLSAEKYHLVLNKEQILANNNNNKQHNHNHIHKCFSYKTITNSGTLCNNNKNKMYLNINTSYNDEHDKKSNKSMSYYHNNNNEYIRKKKGIVTSYLNYNPCYTVIWKKTITGPTWKSMQGRQNKTLEINDRDYFIKQNESTHKCLVNMDKQTQRGDINQIKDVRFHKETKYSTTTSSLPLPPPKPLTTTSTTISKPHNNMKAPDFNKTLSRENIKHTTPQIPPCGYLHPNYSFTRERVKTISFFKPNKTKSRISKKINGYDFSLLYNPDNIISKVNNHKQSSSPKFDTMLSRPCNDVLPSHMINLFNRNAVNCLTNQTLKMNNYEHSSFNKEVSNTFLPKRSYNKFVNLKLLKGYKAKDKKENDERVKKEINYLSERIKKKRGNKKKYASFSEYDHNFDNVTYKSFKLNGVSDYKYMEYINKHH